jgi:hypothetical protein
MPAFGSMGRACPRWAAVPIVGAIFVSQQEEFANVTRPRLTWVSPEISARPLGQKVDHVQRLALAGVPRPARL